MIGTGKPTSIESPCKKTGNVGCILSIQKSDYPGDGCDGPWLAKLPSLYVSPSRSHSKHCDQGEGGEALSDSKRSKVTRESLVCRDSGAAMWRALVPARAVESEGLYPEADKLRFEGLDPAVTATIQGCRELSITRFESWCLTKGLVLIQCLIAAILSFLQ